MERLPRVQVDAGTPGNGHPGLRRAWHPVAFGSELPCRVTLLGRGYDLRVEAGVLHTDPEPYAVTERWGLVWIAPEEPLTDLFTDPDDDHDDGVGAWLPALRTTTGAEEVTAAFLDDNRFPYVHALPGTDPDVSDERFGCRGVLEHEGLRATYAHRAPFQLLLRVEELGVTRTVLLFTQPETSTSTRVYAKLIHGGTRKPSPEQLAREVAFEAGVLAEDLRDPAPATGTKLAAALRRALTDFLGAAP